MVNILKQEEYLGTYPLAVIEVDDDLGYKRSKYLCGYVGVKEGHPAFGLDYGELDIEVHGGVTFAGHHELLDPSETLWYFGFDCAHYGDTIESQNTRYVSLEVVSMAKQIHALSRA